MPAYHPDLAASARWLPRGLGRRWALPLLRAVFRAGGRVARGIEEVPVGEGSVFVYPPPTAPEGPGPAVLWIHGGGLVMGDARQDHDVLVRMAEELGVRVVAAQHRLAPEHPFPAPLDDLVAAFGWLADRPDVDPARIAVGGVSAGGGLAAALCQRLRDAGGPTPCFQVLVYPMLDDRSATGEGLHDRDFRVWDRRSNALGWSSYLGGQPPETPYAVPARTDDLAGLPPAWIGVGTLDLFHDEDLAYAERLRAAGVEVALHVVEGAYHGFDVVAADAPVSKAFREAQLQALKTALAGG